MLQVSIPLADITAGCLLTTQGDTQYTMYLQPPEETITARLDFQKI